MGVDYQHALTAACAIAVDAGKMILALKRDMTGLAVSQKVDHTPVTVIDQQADAFICSALLAFDPSLPIVSEEGGQHIAASTTRYWLVDPLDGTKGFIAGSAEYTVNIALVVSGQPVLGVIYAPELDELYWASEASGAWLRVGEGAAQPLQTTEPSGSWRVVTSQFHDPARVASMLSAALPCTVLQMNSSLKFTLIARGMADVYFRLGPTSHWDSAAGQCILSQAGGAVIDFHGESLHYSAGASTRNPAFIALGDCRQQSRLVTLATTLQKDGT